ncbi:MAG: DUF4421 family protein [Flavobacteriales bacterium]
MYLLRTLFALLFVSTLQAGSGQGFLDGKTVTYDSAYVRDFSDRPTVRLYFSNKFNSMVVRADGGTDIRYRPNGNYNMGIGASYRRLTLNIAFPIPFLNDDRDKKGRTRYLDAQATIHTQRQASNLFLQVFKGYHITSHDQPTVGWVQTTAFAYREDLLQFNIGMSSVRIRNAKRFSYRASFTQDAWQQRSQGTWLYGAYATFYALYADSALVPFRLRDQFAPSAAISEGIFADIGPIGGYARTFVYRRHWFLTLSAALGVGLSLQHLTIPEIDGTTTTTDLGPGWRLQLRGAIGYNARYNFIGLVFNQERVGFLLPQQDRFAWDVGNLRLMFVERFRAKPERVDKGLKWLKQNTPL